MISIYFEGSGSWITLIRFVFPGMPIGIPAITTTRSFFLAIPALAAASFLGIYNIYTVGSEELNFLAIIAVIFSIIFSYMTIAFFLNFIKKFSLNVFIIYRLILSLFLLYIVYF